MYPKTPEQTKDRPTVTGRCDQLKMNQLEANTGLCMKTIQPEPIKWIIDPESLPEIKDLSPELRSKIIGANGEKYIVTIPWDTYKQDGMNYYPNCSKAVFSDGSSAAGLFEDNGTNTCNKKKINRTEYKPKYRPYSVAPNYSGLTGYVN